ncbi:MAG: TRAP transporter small permease [Chloroflexota bacterium]
MLRLLDRTLKYLLVAAVAALTISVFLQVLVRFVLRVPLPWTEEASRIAFVYCVFIGATLGVREKAHINVDVLVAVLPPGARFALKMVTNLLVAALLCAMIWLGADFVLQTGVQMTPVLQIPFRYLYVVIPASGALMLLYLILGTLDDLRGRKTS